MKREFSLLLLFIFLISITNSISASNMRIGIGFSFDLNLIIWSDPHFILSMEGDFGEDLNYRIEKDFLGEKDLKLIIGRYYGNKSDDARSSLALGIRYIDEDNSDFMIRTEFTTQEAFLEDLFSFSSENYIERLQLEYFYPSLSSELQLHRIYWPKDENYFIKYISY